MYEYLDDDLILKGQLYIENYPNSISNAIYNYGDSEIREMIAYYEYDEQGFILTNSALYLSFVTNTKLNLKDINRLKYSPKNNILMINDYILATDGIDLDNFSKLLNEMTSVDVTLDLLDEEKIEYYINMVLDDLLNSNYEDVLLSNDDYKKIKEFKEEIALINTYDQVQKEEEYDVLNRHALEFFDELELDSEEIDALEKIHLQHQNLNNQTFNNSMNQYEDLINGLKNGDPTKMNKIKSMASSLGIDLDALQNKSPEELNQYVDDLCERFNISKSQLETLAKRFSK